MPNRKRRRVKKPPAALVHSAQNASALLQVAKDAAARGHFGTAVALEVLALEEAAKAQVLGVRFIAASANLPVDYPDELLDKVLSNDHLSRHAFANVQMYKQDVYRRLQSGDPFRRAVTDEPPFVESRLLKRVRWLNGADRMKQRGLYVNARGGPKPADITKADFDEATLIVEPYVAETLRQASEIS